MAELSIIGTYNPWTNSQLHPKVLSVDADKIVAKKFGRRIRVLRESKGWSQERLADEAVLDRSYVGGIERGDRNPSLKNIARIADALGVPIRVLFDDDDA